MHNLSLQLSLYFSQREFHWKHVWVVVMRDPHLSEGFRCVARAARGCRGLKLPQSEAEGPSSSPKWNDILYRGLWRAAILRPSQASPQPPYFESLATLLEGLLMQTLDSCTPELFREYRKKMCENNVVLFEPEQAMSIFAYDPFWQSSNFLSHVVSVQKGS